MAGWGLAAGCSARRSDKWAERGHGPRCDAVSRGERNRQRPGAARLRRGRAAFGQKAWSVLVAPPSGQWPRRPTDRSGVGDTVAVIGVWAVSAPFGQLVARGSVRQPDTRCPHQARQGLDVGEPAAGRRCRTGRTKAPYSDFIPYARIACGEDRCCLRFDLGVEAPQRWVRIIERPMKRCRRRRRPAPTAHSWRMRLMASSTRRAATGPGQASWMRFRAA